MSKYEIKAVSAKEIINSRGEPTIETTVTLASGITGSASVPAGASTGKNEAKVLLDNDTKRFFGKGVLRAVKAVNLDLSFCVVGKDVRHQKEIDEAMIETDGTGDKKRLGANSLLSISLAVARAAANVLHTPLFKYLSEGRILVLPTPMFNIINGGAHSDNNLDFQEFMVLPTGMKCFADKVQAGVEIYVKLKELLNGLGKSTAVGDEGGFAPNLDNAEQALNLIVEAIGRAGYSTEKVKIALDVASSAWFKNGKYHLPKENKTFEKSQLLDYYESLLSRFPIVSIEDGLYEEDFTGWAEMTKRFNHKCFSVGDDLFTTNRNRLSRGIAEGSANAILIKPNQIGTLSETLETIELAKNNDYTTIISHRSGETNDSFIADLAVATSSTFIKAGAPCRGERLAKYNRLLRIEELMAE